MPKVILPIITFLLVTEAAFAQRVTASDLEESDGSILPFLMLIASSYGVMFGASKLNLNGHLSMLMVFGAWMFGWIPAALLDRPVSAYLLLIAGAGLVGLGAEWMTRSRRKNSLG